MRYNHNHDPKNGRFASASGGGTSNDWTGAEPQSHTKEEMNAVVDYAKSKGIQFYNPYKFDGDIELLKEQIDVLDGLKKEYGITRKVTISVGDMDDDDFAITTDHSIVYNIKALRNREITNKNLQSDNWLATDDVTGITVHEFGHIISKKYGEKGLDIARQAYYNINKQSISTDDLVEYLSSNVSEYSVKATKRTHKTVYLEVTSEMLSKEMYGKPDKFSGEFVRLLKGRCSG